MTVPAPISLLIPVRAQSLDFAIERLQMRERVDLSEVELIVTDDGSRTDISDGLREYCQHKKWRYARLDTANKPFSLARARNAGLAMASGEWVFFDDLDMAYDTRFFASMRTELDLLETIPLNFLSIPAVYLKQSISADIIDNGQIAPFIPEILAQLAFEDPRGADDNRTIESFAPASAILALRRETALTIGGYDESFSGWGGEDREFIFRLLAENSKLPRPRDFAQTRRWNLNDTHEFAGWRALFRLHGDYLARKGLYGFHLYHPPNAWRPETGRSNIDRAARMAAALQVPEISSDNRDGRHAFLRRSTLFSVYGTQVSSIAPRRNAVRRSKPAAFLARLRKLKRDPHSYFRDSRSPVLRRLSRFFPIRENEVEQISKE